MAVNTIHQDGDNGQLRSVIFNATPLAIQQTKSIAKQFEGKTELDTCKNIFDYLLNKITYKADGHHQQVKLPSALLRERVGDCKSYSVFTYAILTNLGIGCKYALTSYNNEPTPSHIYVITDSGIIIDAVWGKFNSEKTPTYKYLKKIEDMKISTITGINATANTHRDPSGRLMTGKTHTANSKYINSCCDFKPIGLTAGQWYDQNKGLVDSGDKRVHIAAILPAKPMRLLMLNFIKANGGGIATSIYNKIYRAAGVKILDQNRKEITTGVVLKKDVDNYREFLKSWYRFGGSPNDVRLAVLEGKNNRPKGRDANYMLMISKTRGLKPKDLGLIVRGILSAFGGAQFNWGSDGTYILGNKKVGIGEPVTIATVTAWITAISALFMLLSKIFDFVESKIEQSKAKKESEKLETDGYILEQDYYSLPIPRKPVTDIKQISMPTAEAPNLEDTLSAVEFFGNLFSDKPQSTTPPTLAEFEKQQKQGSVPPFVAQEIENAKKDKFTLEALQKAATLTNKLVPKDGETILNYYKLGNLNVDTNTSNLPKTAGFGGIILPMLIGVGALIALNTKKK